MANIIFSMEELKELKPYSNENEVETIDINANFTELDIDEIIKILFHVDEHIKCVKNKEESSVSINNYYNNKKIMLSFYYDSEGLCISLSDKINGLSYEIAEVHPDLGNCPNVYVYEDVLKKSLAELFINALETYPKMVEFIKSREKN